MELYMSQANAATSTHRRPRRWRRRILLAFACLVLVACGGIFYFIWFSSYALNELMAEMDRDDPGWRLEEIEAKRRAVPDDRNSALQIMAVRRLQGGQAVIITQGIQPAFDNLLPQVQLNEQQSELLASRFEGIKQAVVEARKLKDMPDGRFPIKYSADFFTTHLDCQEARGVAELLLWDAAVRVHALDADGALESCLALHNAARAMDDEPFLISLLVRYALNAITAQALERLLAQGQFTEASEPGLKRMQIALAAEKSEPRFLTALRGERAGAHHLFQALLEGKASAGILGNDFEFASHLPGFIEYHHVAVLRLHNKFVAAAKLAPEEADKQLEALDKNMQQESIFVRAVIPAFMKIREADRRIQATLGCAIAALAAERFRLAQNRWPESLDELVNAGFLDAVLADPYDHKPIRLKRTADGLVIYAVGPDKIDNGGLIDRERPTDPGTDVGFRLWDISARRQPPNPPVPEEELVK
jgi:hypothetical protein